MTQPKRRPRLNDDQRCVLEYLAVMLPTNDGWVYVIDLQRATVWPIRPELDSLQRRRMIEWHGGQSHLYRDWRITEAGLGALR